ncbi:ACT domain-containing protein [bacterium]|nr:ACT domain-containing protein [bacterium]
MFIMQLSVFLENRLGRLKEVLAVLSKNKINIRAMSLAEKSDYGMLRLIVQETEKAVEILKDENISVNLTPVIVAEVIDKPGGLLAIIEPLESNSVNVEYIYAFVEKSGDKALVVVRVEEPEKAATVLREENIKLLEREDIERI